MLIYGPFKFEKEMLPFQYYDLKSFWNCEVMEIFVAIALIWIRSPILDPYLIGFSCSLEMMEAAEHEHQRT
jgi:hypothetical protein